MHPAPMDLHPTWQVHLRDPMTRCVRCDVGPWPPRERGDLRVEAPSQNLHWLLIMIHQGTATNTTTATITTTDQRFHVLPNYFGHLFFSLSFLRYIPRFSYSARGVMKAHTASGVWGGAPTANLFWRIYSSQNTLVLCQRFPDVCTQCNWLVLCR